MPILNPSQLKVEGFSYDGSCVSIGLGLSPVPNAIMKLAYGHSLEGVDYTRALGQQKPVAMTPGVYTPGDITMTVHKAYSQALRGLISPVGAVLKKGVSFSLTAQYKVSFSGGSPVGALISLSTQTDTLEGCRVINIVTSNETGGAALMEEWTLKCMLVRENGNAAL